MYSLSSHLRFLAVFFPEEYSLDARLHLLYNLYGQKHYTRYTLRLQMSEDNITGLSPLSTVRFGMGKEIRLYTDELVVTGSEEDQETRLHLSSIKRLILMPGDPNPAKLIFMADLQDDTTIILVEGMTNARDFRAMLPHIIELCPDIQLDPPDMYEQLRQALNNRRAWALTCYGSVLLFFLLLFTLYLVVVFIGAHH
jgi:hypothetical protein